MPPPGGGVSGILRQSVQTCESPCFIRASASQCLGCGPRLPDRGLQTVLHVSARPGTTEVPRADRGQRARRGIRPIRRAGAMGFRTSGNTSASPRASAAGAWQTDRGAAVPRGASGDRGRHPGGRCRQPRPGTPAPNSRTARWRTCPRRTRSAWRHPHPSITERPHIRTGASAAGRVPADEPAGCHQGCHRPGKKDEQAPWLTGGRRQCAGERQRAFQLAEQTLDEHQPP